MRVFACECWPRFVAGGRVFGQGRNDDLVMISLETGDVVRIREPFGPSAPPCGDALFVTAWGDKPLDRIHEISLATHEVRTLGPFSFLALEPFAAETHHVYAVDPGGRVVRVARDGTPLRLLRTLGPNPPQLHLRDGFIYGRRTSLFRFAASGEGPLELVADSGDGVADIALDTTHAYFVTFGIERPKQLSRVPLGGGPTEILVDDVRAMTSRPLAIDGGALFWTTDEGIVRLELAS